MIHINESGNNIVITNDDSVEQNIISKPDISTSIDAVTGVRISYLNLFRTFQYDELVVNGDIPTSASDAIDKIQVLLDNYVEPPVTKTIGVVFSVDGTQCDYVRFIKNDYGGAPIAVHGGADGRYDVTLTNGWTGNMSTFYGNNGLNIFTMWYASPGVCRLQSYDLAGLEADFTAATIYVEMTEIIS